MLFKAAEFHKLRDVHVALQRPAENVREPQLQIMKRLSFLRIACVFAALLLTGSLTGCLSLKAYVDPALPALSKSKMPAVQNPSPVTVLFEFQSKGNANARGTSELRPRAVAVVAESGMFKSVSGVASAEDTGVLKIVINNVVEDQNAAMKGFGTGLTFGLAGSMVSDAYVCNASYTRNGKTVTTTLRHAIHSTVGNHSGPPGLTAMTLQDALNQVIDQLVLNALKNLHEQHAFEG